MPHFGHVIGPAIVDLTAGVLVDLAIGSRDISCLFSGRGRRETFSGVHIVCDIDPDDPANMFSFFAFEWTQAAPQRARVNDLASMNI